MNVGAGTSAGVSECGYNVAFGNLLTLCYVQLVAVGIEGYVTVLVVNFNHIPVAFLPIGVDNLAAVRCYYVVADLSADVNAVMISAASLAKS